MKKKEDNKVIENGTVKVCFIKTYIGDLGIFYKNKTYELSGKLYELFKNDCEEVK
jgi:hypothetical protein